MGLSSLPPPGQCAYMDMGTESTALNTPSYDLANSIAAESCDANSYTCFRVLLHAVSSWHSSSYMYVCVALKRAGEISPK